MIAPMELPLVVFTVLAQASVGIVVMSLVQGRATQGPDGTARRQWGLAAVLLAVGLVASLAHLGHPLGAPMAVKHLSTAWLSREVLATGALLGLIAVGALTMREALNPGLAWLAALVGLGALLAMGMTYSPPALPAVNNVLPFVFFTLTAAILGAAFGSMVVSHERERLLARVLASALLVALVVYLVIPCVWLSGGTVTELTGKAWIASPIYWARIVFGLALPLAVVWRRGTVPTWLPVVLLLGELAGRLVFFGETMHTAANMGGLY